MKHLPIHNSQYRTLLKNFGQHLERVGYSKGSQQAMPSCVREFLYRLEQHGIHHLEQVTPSQIRQHYQYLGERPNQKYGGTLSSAMIHHHLYAIRTLMNLEHQQGHISTNPFGVLTFPRPKSPPRQILTIPEIKTLYQSAETLKDKAMLSLFYGCGLRKSEAIALNTTDLNFKGQLLYVRSGKGKRRRVVPMTRQVADDLQNYYHHERSISVREVTKDNQQAFILNHQGHRMREYWKRIKYLVRQAGLSSQISLHHLRHSIATHLLESGLSLEQVRDFLGHNYLESTQTYTRISKQYLVHQTQ